ncbi:DoxX family protein [Kitasatospora sp. NPDC054939]
MSAHVVVTVVAAFLSAFSAGSVFLGAEWTVKPLADYGVPRGWWMWLGTAKAAGALGLLVGLAVPAIGLAAGTGLVLYYTGAVITVLRARSYAHTAFPLVYMAPVVGALILAA